MQIILTEFVEVPVLAASETHIPSNSSIKGKDQEIIGEGSQNKCEGSSVTHDVATPSNRGTWKRTQSASRRLNKKDKEQKAEKGGNVRAWDDGLGLGDILGVRRDQWGFLIDRQREWEIIGCWLGTGMISLAMKKR
ncbi:glutathione S-transferase family protein [Striga asiatica]|uniref:Glutathione S-transferase family protein n=1 Tax=Striga asiatica TaxID=4170 RepID=A0A5A7QIQ1_STRAF|nr:glutathione S-transferase family protein [Striga asiatica]